MGWGTGNLGGGSGGLNFKVVGYATEAELLADTPKENTIGIITTNKITGWMFSATEPESPVEGMVYITTGTDSDIAFNALKKNGIQVYPLSAKQYVSGALVDVTAMSYQGGEWLSWWNQHGALFWHGNQCTDLTGGWTVAANGTSTATKPTATYNEDSVNIKSTGSANSGNWTTSKAVDLTNAKTLSVYLSDATISGSLRFRVGPEGDGITGTKPVVNLAISSAGLHSTDVSSLSGKYYVRLYCYGVVNLTVTEVYYE